MLGFDYVVLSASNEKLAMWSESSQAHHWLDELVKAGRATCSDVNGFLNVYTLTAAELLPYLSRLGKHVCYFESSVLTCTVDEILTIEVWDAG